MPIFVAERMHDSAGAMHPADWKELSGNTRQELVDDAYTGLKPGYYPASIYVKGSNDALWHEGSGWTKKADEVIPE